MKRIFLLAGAAVMALSANAVAEEGDAAAGEKVFRKCMACHAVGEDARNKVGPALNGVVGRGWGEVEDYRYSKSLLKGKEEGKTWDMETLDAYLKKPKDVIPKGKMAFAGLRKDDDRADVIAYLSQYNADGSTK
ncbi:c-type cytochrome [Stappia stellulata]|uniref:c-type cytochrome n=1 Tax=Stappia stellulata TaxID=71235 RepID=UPI000425727E|nr:cytochrome c family protein [Stappia stellulata]